MYTNSNNFFFREMGGEKHTHAQMNEVGVCGVGGAGKSVQLHHFRLDTERGGGMWDSFCIALRERLNKKPLFLNLGSVLLSFETPQLDTRQHGCPEYPNNNTNEHLKDGPHRHNTSSKKHCDNVSNEQRVNHRESPTGVVSLQVRSRFTPRFFYLDYHVFTRLPVVGFMLCRQSLYY